jgi:hypothetical protein
MSETELRRRFLIAHHTLHAFWSAAVGGGGYNKAYWRGLDNEQCRLWRDRFDAAGITGPLL